MLSVKENWLVQGKNPKNQPLKSNKWEVRASAIYMALGLSP